MFTEALYYPDILIPDNQWLRRAILYWDKINPIVPWETEREIPSDHVSRQLQEAGILEFIDPEKILHYEDGRELSKSFLKVVKNKTFLSKIGPLNIRRYNVKIHRNKFGYGLLEEIKDQQLYEDSPSQWVYFENRSGLIYLGFLASTIAKCLNLEPITNDSIFQRGYLQAQIIPSPKHLLSINSLKLERLLPSPREGISIIQLLLFKAKYERELLSFRKSIKKSLESLGKVNPVQYQEKLVSIKDEIQEECLILDARLKENRIETIYNSLEIPFKIVNNDPTTLGTLVAATGLTISVPITAAVFGAYAAINISREVYNGHVRANSILEENPYSYVFNIKRKLGGKY